MCSSHSSSVGFGTALDDVGVGTVPKALFGTMPKTSSSPSAPYASALQATLDHPRTFAAFYHWLSARGRAYVLDFWLAIWAFRRAWLDRDPRAPRIGMAFHRRFVSPHSGCCEFLPPALRAERTERLQREQMCENFFDACAPHAWACLTREHMQYAMMRGVARGAEKRNGGESAQRQMAEHQRESGQEGECGGGKEAECHAFALQLVHKLDALAHKTAEEQTTEAAECDEDACDAAGAEASVTPERMCAWMQFASAYSGLTALSSSCCNNANADGVSSSCSSTAGGYMTFSIGSQPSAQLQAVQQQHPPHQQRHCDNTPTTPATSATSFMMMASAIPGSRNGSNGTSPCSMGMAGSTAAATGAPVMTITYREAGGVGPPFVVRVAPQAVVTFREFRHLFAIPARSNKRFLFKEHRFDEPLDGAHFQWTAIYDDESPLPIFFGQIVAECRTLSESD
ncbi:hypothetical protein niasHT_029530 [Heterodera trifolii]|uniref:DIX domain-containing protein n=1 Tax=Heterodera trifolii TaxID=157864 RepID=A0ABD2JAX5_9BILA